MLRTAWALQVEVEFNSIYQGQPLFGDVDAFLRDQGFVLRRLTNLCHYTLNTQADNEPFPDRQVFASSTQHLIVDFTGHAGRLFWAEAFFVRRELADKAPPSDATEAARAACVLSVLGFDDLAETCVSPA